jgi:hypothetical protein
MLQAAPPSRVVEGVSLPTGGVRPHDSARCERGFQYSGHSQRLRFIIEWRGHSARSTSSNSHGCEFDKMVLWELLVVTVVEVLRAR